MANTHCSDHQCINTSWHVNAWDQMRWQIGFGRYQALLIPLTQNVFKWPFVRHQSDKALWRETWHITQTCCDDLCHHALDMSALSPNESTKMLFNRYVCECLILTRRESFKWLTSCANRVTAQVSKCFHWLFVWIRKAVQPYTHVKKRWFQMIEWVTPVHVMMLTSEHITSVLMHTIVDVISINPQQCIALI